MGLFQRLFKRKIKQSLLLSTNIAILLFPLAFVPISSSGQPTRVEAKGSEIKLSLASHSVVESVSTKPSIQPGESQDQKIAREAAEAAQAQADAEAKAKAAAQAKAQADAAAKAQAAAAQRNVAAREATRSYSAPADPSNFDQIYRDAGAAYGVDPAILKAIHTVETGASGSTAVTSSAGAQGPMQFLPSTWRAHGVDGNGDGHADINNVSDAIYTAAAYLRACGYPDVKKALWGYNPSTAYYNKVMGYARSFGYQG